MSAISFVKTLASTHQHELDLLRSQVPRLAPLDGLPCLRPGALDCRECAVMLGGGEMGSLCPCWRTCTAPKPQVDEPLRNTACKRVYEVACTPPFAST